ncbi:hypothetical protein BX666DRAFT_2032491 [Dichotomocladium elegans]|nr:hypothetical protein BX666DRAFT_2032491 [Dichotomocladium elegans]
MAALIQQQTQTLSQSADVPRTVDGDIALTSYITNKLHLEPQQEEATGALALPSEDWRQQQQEKPHQFRYYSDVGSTQRSRPRISGKSSTIHVTKSSSTPPKRSAQPLMQQQQQQQHYGRHQSHPRVTERPPSLSSTTSSSAPSPSLSLESGRRGSVNSTSSDTLSVRSSMSANSKLSLSKRLRKVFSMSSLRFQPKESAPESALPQQGSPRRRSFASFLKKDSLAVSSNQNKDHTLMTDEAPMPTPSSSSTCSESISLAQQHQLHSRNMAPQVGIHYGLPMHASPRLKPAPAMSSSSSISSVTTPLERRRLYFCPTIQVHETFAAGEYDRRTDSNATCQKMTPVLAMRIKQELNEYKLTEMQVHDDSRKFTQFFL